MNQESSLKLNFKTNLPLAFDYQSTTPCDLEVIEAMSSFWNENYGNPSNRNNFMGLNASAAVSIARGQLADYLNVLPERVIFTSGATEANNLALLGYCRARAIELGKPGHLITIATEHLAVLEPLRELKKEGFRLTEIIPDSSGIVSCNQLEDCIEKDTILVSIMMANNEIGVLQPLNELVNICRKNDVVFHSDGAQAFGYMDFSIDNIGIDLLSISSHKLYGPKGIGALVIKEGMKLKPLYSGGGQELGIRPGTLPVPLIVGFAKAAEISFLNINTRNNNIKKLRDKLWNVLKQECPDLIINGSLEHRLPHNLNFTVPKVLGSRLHKQLKPYISCSSGSACSNGSASHVLLAIGRSISEAQSSLRLSLGRNTTESDIDQASTILIKSIKKLRSN